MSVATVPVSTTCPVCMVTSVIDVPADGHARFKAGEGLIQDLLPTLTPAQREMLISGVCGQCFDDMFKEDDEDGYEDDEDDL